MFLRQDRSHSRGCLLAAFLRQRRSWLADASRIPRCSSRRLLVPERPAPISRSVRSAIETSYCGKRQAEQRTLLPSQSDSSMQLRMLSPGCVGFTIWSLRQSVVINQVHVHRLSLDKAEDNTPVARDAPAPLPAPVALSADAAGRQAVPCLGPIAPPPVPSRCGGYGGSGVAAPVGHRPVRPVVAVLLCAHLMQRYVAEARCVANLAVSSRLPGGALRSSGRFVAFTLKSLR